MGRPILVVLALLALPATAQAPAARLDVDPGEGRTRASSVLVYKAAAGEANRLTVTLDDAPLNLHHARGIRPRPSSPTGSRSRSTTAPSTPTTPCRSPPGRTAAAPCLPIRRAAAAPARRT